jgi:hypothetical protein
MKRTLFAVAAALVLVGTSVAQETVKDRKSFIPNRKQAAVPGKVVGILLTGGQTFLDTEGRSGPANQLVFSSGNNSYRWIYVPTQDNAQITNLRVPVGDKGEHTVYAALNLANPQAVLPWAVTQPYALVELEVNGGRGSPAGDSFVATNMRVIEGTKDFPLKTADVLKQVKDTYAEYLTKQKDAIEKAMKDAGEKALKGKAVTGPRERKELMYMTWLPESSTMRIAFKTTISDGAYTVIKGPGPGPLPPRPVPLPPKKAALNIDAATRVVALRPAPIKGMEFKSGTTFGIEFGRAYLVNKKGEVTATEDLAIDSFTQQVNSPVFRPGPLPRPVPLPPAPPNKQ